METRKRKNSKSTHLTRLQEKRLKQAKPLTIVVPEPSTLEEKVDIHKRSILGFRSMNEQLFIHNDRVTVLKTAILLNLEALPAEIQAAEHKNLHRIWSHRPIATITHANELGSPTVVQTPKGSLLPRVASFGVLSLFSNGPYLQPILNQSVLKKIPKKSAFFNTSVYDYIQKPVKSFKTASATITYKKLESCRENDIKNKYRRAISQNKLMVNDGVSEKYGSATQYVLGSKLFHPSLRWEWLHMIAHSFLGTETQDKNNLVAGTAYANTEMMFAEGSLNYLSRVYPQGFTLSVKADLIPDTQIAYAIHYTMTTPDFSLTYQFNPQTNNRPHANYQDYFNYFIQQLVYCIKVKPDILAQSEKLFYRKDDIKALKLPLATIKDFPVTFNSLQFSADQSYVIFDTETTGLFVPGARVVQIGGIHSKTKEVYKETINPGCPIPKFLKYRGIHNVTDEVVIDKPFFNGIEKTFIKFIDNNVLVGHNLAFDLTMIENELRLNHSHETLVGRPALDTLELSRRVAQERKLSLKSHKLDNLCQHYNIDLKTRAKGHDALVDAKLTAKLFCKLHTLFHKPITNKSSSSTPHIPEVKVIPKPAIKFK